MNEDDMLSTLASSLMTDVDALALGGEGAAWFLYATGNSRAVEASLDDQDSIWVEFWTDSLDKEAEAVSERTFECLDAAEAGVRRWLCE